LDGAASAHIIGATTQRQANNAVTLTFVKLGYFPIRSHPEQAALLRRPDA
jgi:hypothetical protein